MCTYTCIYTPKRIHIHVRMRASAASKGLLHAMGRKIEPHFRGRFFKDTDDRVCVCVCVNVCVCVCVRVC